MTGSSQTGVQASADVTASATNTGIFSTVDAAKLPKKKQTTLGLYLSSSDAAKALEGNSGIVFLDVRDPIEVGYVGHPAPIDANVPVALAVHEFDVAHGAYKMALAPDFISDVEGILARKNADRNSPVFVMCRSGVRSAAAAQILTDAGFTNVWNLVEGFEGDTDETGGRSINGWRNAGLSWAYKLTPEQAWKPKEDVPK